MERASRVMYSIANFFTWILVLLYAVSIVFSILIIGGVFKPDDPNIASLGNTGTLVWLIIAILVALFTISLVRIAKDRRSSKGWDILFIVLGAISGNVFYVLGGIFGVIAIRR